MQAVLEAIRAFCVILVMAYLLSRANFFNEQYTSGKLPPRKLAFSIAVFFAIAMYGELVGLISGGESAFDTRVAGIALSGFLFEPLAAVGVAAPTAVIALIGQSQNMPADLLAMAITVLLSSLSHKRYPRYDALLAGIIVGAIEIVHMLLIVLLVKPEAVAKEFVYSNSFSFIVMSGCAVMVFILIVVDMTTRRQLWEKESASKSELAVSAVIQRSLLETDFHLDRRLDLHAFLQPARDVGGDLYGYYLDDGRYFRFILGDVSGKGIPASITMSRTKTAFQAFAREKAGPDQILSEINGMLYENNEAQMFVTAVAGELDLETGRFVYSNAGHTAPVIVTEDGGGCAADAASCAGGADGASKADAAARADGASAAGDAGGAGAADGEDGAVRQAGAALMDKPSCFPLGIIKKAKYSTMECFLRPGQHVVLYTDGITEAEDPAKKLFGEDRLLDVLNELAEASQERAAGTDAAACSALGLRAEQVNDAVLAAVRAHADGAEQSDDIALFTFGWNAGPLTYRFNANYDELTAAEKALSSDLQALRIDGKTCDTLVLAFEELASNVVKYGYAASAVDASGSAAGSDGADGSVADGAQRGRMSNVWNKMGEGTGRIQVSVWPDEAHPVMQIDDDSVPYDPFQTAAPQLDASATERPMGGLGVHMVRNRLRSYEYRSAHGTNTLILRLKGSQDADADAVGTAAEGEVQ